MTARARMARIKFRSGAWSRKRRLIQEHRLERGAMIAIKRALAKRVTR